VFYVLKNKLNRLRFEQTSRRILKTTPFESRPASGLAVLSQLCHRDLLMYLIALKTFARQVPVAAVYVLSDGSLTSEDIQLLRQHIPGVTIRYAKDVDTRACPRGSCWERLLSIADLTSQWYTIQLDADTLSLGSLPEVVECVENNQSFTIGTWDNQTFEPMQERQREAARLIQGKPDAHVQLVAEANFHHLKRFEQLRYVRGCAGFSGFAKGDQGRSLIEEISSEMSAAMGARWNEWGTEQVMSNIVVANSPMSRVLPHPRYCDCTKIRDGETHFIHFIGTCRFKGGTYARLARQQIDSMTNIA
jgi:hypothetical protein